MPNNMLDAYILTLDFIVIKPSVEVCWTEHSNILAYIFQGRIEYELLL